MRSGPSALITRRVTCRQVKRAGGPSGISASTVKGSGRVKRSGGRGGFGKAGSGQQDGPAKALLRPCANSGMWLPIGKRRRTARAPKRLIRPLINGSARGLTVPLVHEV